jgi:hypothetical protein
MVTNDLEKIIVVHPHEEFDEDLTCQSYTNQRMRDFNENNALVLQGFKEDEKTKSLTDEKLEIYLGSNLKYRTAESVCGEISESELQRIVCDNSTLHLLGGIVGQCHRRAFFDIVDYIQKNDIHNVNIVTPFDGSYLKQCYVECNTSLENAERFYGIWTPKFEILEMNGKESYSLKEVATKVFSESDEYRNKKQLKDESGTPVVANLSDIRKNLEENIFDSYMNIRRKKVINREHNVTVDKNNICIHIK